MFAPIVLGAELRAQGVAVSHARDVGIATVRYDNGQTRTAASLFESIDARLGANSLSGFGLLSLFDDGKWSMQGSLGSLRSGRSLVVPSPFRKVFDSMRGETGLEVNSTAQQGFMPTLQFLGESRIRFDGDRHGGRVGATLARTFDGREWRTSVLGEASGWISRRGVQYRLSFAPQQMQIGDLLADWNASSQWTAGETDFEVTAGIRQGEAGRGTTGWGTFSATRYLRGVLTTFAFGSYPVDLLQALPGGRFVALTTRVPARLPWKPAPPAPLPPPPPREPTAVEALAPLGEYALRMGAAYDSLGLRAIEVWAPSARVVEIMADFVNWVPVPLIRGAEGIFTGYYHVTPGRHRFHLRIDGVRIVLPPNVAHVRDEFSGEVAVIYVR